MADSKEDGHQINNDSLTKAIVAETGCQPEEVDSLSFSMTSGSKEGENFTCVLFAVTVKAKIKGIEGTFNYMIKCLPANLVRAKFLLDLDGFQKECYVYGELMSRYEELRMTAGLQPLRVPKCFLADSEAGIIVMENLKTQHYTMLDKIAGEEMPLDLAVKMVKATAGFHATGYHFLKTVNDGTDKFLEQNKSLVHHGWFNAKDSAAKKQNDEGAISYHDNLVALVEACAEGKDESLRTLMPTLTMDNIDNVFSVMNMVPDGFNTIIHNDLHMNNAMYRKQVDGKVEDVVLLDLQLIKCARPAVDLVYLFGSSSTPAYRAKHLKQLLQIYSETLTKELVKFGYPPSTYNHDQLIADFKDCWIFGYIAAIMHTQLQNVSFKDGDFDMAEFLDESTKEEAFKKLAQKQLENARKNKPHVEKMLSIVREMVEGIEKIL